MKHSYLIGLRKAIWRLRYRSAKAILPVVRHETESEIASAVQLGKPTSFPKPTYGEFYEAKSLSDSASKLRRDATKVWRDGDRARALRMLRGALREHPMDSLLWMSFGQRLQELGNTDVAYLAYTNAVEIDPGNFVALEQFISIADSRDDTAIVNRILSRLPGALEARPHRYLDSLDYSIPYGIDDAITIVEENAEGVAAGIVDNFRTRNLPVRKHASENDSIAVELRTAVVFDDVKTALRLLRTVSASEIPADSLRRSIRRVRVQATNGRNDLRELIEHYLRARPDEQWIVHWLPDESDYPSGELMLDGYKFPPLTSHIGLVPARDRIAYLAYNSLPYHSAGYATRTHGLLKELRGQGWNAFGVTRIGYPHDMPGWTDVGTLEPIEQVGGVPYLRLSPGPEVVRKRRVAQYVESYVQRLVERLTIEQPAIVHAASNHLNGLAAVTAARILGIPSIYEVRGLWEVTRGSRDPIWANGQEFRSIARLETDSAKNATRVVAITEALKAELVRRGVDESKIAVIPNGVDTSRFRPMAKDPALAETLNIGDRTVIGYVGSIVDYEGLGLLVEAASALAKERDDFVVLIVGDGAATPDLVRLVEQAEVARYFKFIGRVPHDDVERYYSLIDIAPFPRLPLPVCEIVSPLKPFEAMAMKKAVVASNVAALAEIVTDGVNGVLFEKGDVESLSRSIRLLLDNPELRGRIAESGREWVENSRQWKSLASKMSNIYESLGAQREPKLNEIRETSNDSPQ